MLKRAKTTQGYTLIRSKRRTLRLEIGADTKVTVRAPSHCSNKIIQQFVNEKRDWIINKQKYARENYKQADVKKYVSGENYLYLGKAYPLVIAESGDLALIFNGDNFNINVNQLKVARELLLRWYKEEAFKIITERAKLHSSISGIACKKIGITNSRHRWGSCSSKGNLNFTWRLVMAPLEVIDYMVMHELVHIKIKGHSMVFWQNVKYFIPELDYCRNWLDKNQNLLG